VKRAQGQRCQSAASPVTINESPQAHTVNTSNSCLNSIRQSLVFQYILLAQIPTLGEVTEFLKYWARGSCLARSQPFPGSSIILTLWSPSFKEDGFEPLYSKYKFLLGICYGALKCLLHEIFMARI